MDLVPLIDRIGEPATAALVGLLPGLLFGVIGLATGFCTRSAVLDILDPSRGSRSLLSWLAAFAVAILGTQWLLSADRLAISDSRFLAQSASLTGPLIGGLLFGVGMALARGCTSRLAVLAASGNIRALFTIAGTGLVAAATISGPLSGLRESLARLAALPAEITAPSAHLGVIVAAVLAAVSVVFVLKTRASLPAVLGGAVIGLLFPLTWYMSSELAGQVFEPLTPDSLTTLRPLAAFVSPNINEEGIASLLTQDSGFLTGLLAGACIAAVVLGRFRLEGFGSDQAAPAWRYAAGAVLMGFGGVLAGGCTIGAGFSGGALLAPSALIALASMMTAAAVTETLLTKKPQTLRVSYSAPGE